MRRRLAWAALAVTTLVVVSLTVPLMLLVRRQAADRAKVSAERDVQAIAALVGLTAAGQEGPLTAPDVSRAVGGLEAGLGIVLPDGTVMGDAALDSPILQAVLAGDSRAGPQDGGWVVGLPVQTRHGTVAVVATVPPGALAQGVAPATGLLVGLGLGLIIAGVVVADRLGRSLLLPINDLTAVAQRLGAGQLEARSAVSEPPELADVAAALNDLAARLEEIIKGEREAMADLSHRLRTPLTSLRLQVDNLRDPGERAATVAQLERIETAVDQLITQVRIGRGRSSVADLAATVRSRAAFWRLLAREQGRPFRLEVDSEPAPVAASADELGAMIDALIENVFSHTPVGTAFTLSLGVQGDLIQLVVEDEGPGFSDEEGVLMRGASFGGSTGLGLDIARRLAVSCGGDLRLETRPAGGARVVVSMRQAADTGVGVSID